MDTGYVISAIQGRSKLVYYDAVSEIAWELTSGGITAAHLATSGQAALGQNRCNYVLPYNGLVMLDAGTI